MFSYDNIGEKIKGLATASFIIEGIGAVITGIILTANGEAYGFLISLLGPIVAWVSSWLLYGFGDLIETNKEMSDMMRYQTQLLSRNANQATFNANHNMNTPPYQAQNTYHAPNAQQAPNTYQAPVTNNAPFRQPMPNAVPQQAPNTTPNRQPSPGATAPYNQQAYMAQQEAIKKQQEEFQRAQEERQREESIRINRFERERTQQENEMLSANAIEVKVSHGEVICPTCGNTIECGPVRKPIVCKKCQTAIKPVTNISSTPVQEENYTVAQESIPNETSQRIDREERQRSQQANAQIAQNAVEVKITFGEIVCPSCGDTTESGPILKPFVCKKCKTAIKPIK